MLTSAVLTVSRVSAGYGQVPVLHDVGLSVGPCELVALLGANGAGKTTLLRVIAGELRPSAGEVRFGGRRVDGRRPEQIVAAGVALVPEGRRMFAGLTVRENLLLGGYSRRRADLRPDLARVYGFFPRLADRADHPVGRLSGGEQQMVAIGRALMGRPRLLMIDELSQGLAPTVVDALIDLLPAVAREGTAILLVEQDVEAALEVATRGYVLELGSIVGEGPAGLLRDGASLVEAYLGGAGQAGQ